MTKFVLNTVYPATKHLSVTALSRIILALKIAKQTTVATGIGLVIIVCIQLAYPHNRTRPFLQISGQRYGFMTPDQLQNRISALDDQTQTLTLTHKTYQTTANRLGVHLDSRAVVNDALTYSWEERLVPFSILGVGHMQTPSRSIDDAKLQAFLDQIIKENSQPAHNAMARRTADGGFELISAKDGLTYEASELKARLLELPLTTSATVQLSGKPVIPIVTNQAVQKAIEQANGLDKQAITVNFLSQPIKLEGVQIRAWADISTDEKSGTVAVVYDQAALEAWLQNKAPLVAKTANPAIIYTYDGAEQSRQAGNDGQALEIADTAKAILSAVQEKKNTVNAVVVPVTRKQQVVRAYSRTSKGVAALIHDWQVEQGSRQTAVYFKEIGGLERSAEANADSQFVAASVYKIYVAYYLLTGIDNQTINPNEQIYNGKDVNACIQAMIVISDNNCAIAAANRYGWSNIDNFMKASGFGASSVAHGDNKITAASVGDYMVRLLAGSLMSPGSTQTLLNYMAIQKWRNAIPAGLPGILIQDKVGTYGGYWHDAAIIHSPRATYILVILTRGGTPASIADLAKRVDAIL